MYELTKKKSSGRQIVFGIIVFAFITAVFKIAFSEPKTSLNDDLIEAANEINSHAPIIIDSTTRFDRVNVLPGNVFQYNYTLLDVERKDIDTNSLRVMGKESMIQQMKQNPQAQIFKDNNIEVQAKYMDKSGLDVITVSIKPAEY